MMNKLCFISILFLGVFSLGLVSCSSSENEPTPPFNLEDSSTYSRKELCKRYNLPEDKVLALQYLVGRGDGNIVIYTGSNENNEVVLIICDTLANKALYSNFAALTLPKTRHFTLPYGNEAELPFYSFGIDGFFASGSSCAAAASALYRDDNFTNKFAFVHFRVFLNDGTLKLIEEPSHIETIQTRESLQRWYKNSALYTYNLNENRDFSGGLCCYSLYGDLIKETKYPYLNGSYSILRANFVYPYDYSKAIAISKGYGNNIYAYSADVFDDSLLWLKNNITPSDIIIENSDKIEFSNQSFSNGLLKFTVNITKYNGDIKTYNVAISTDGQISYPTI